MQKDQRLNAQVRTTTAVTLFHAGDKVNVVPGVANASVNHRVHPADSIAWVLEEDQATIDNEEVKVRVIHSRNPLPIAPFGPEDVQYQTVVASVLQAIPDTICVPGLMIANTDMASYLNFTENIYRILPAVADMDDLSRYHGNNERISVQDFSQAVSFYYRIMKNADALVEQIQDLS
ncbi:hypothetical protein B566_EDAN007267 [Ephemera danica]|nr:hypothetical protein B566_EDAN007267 [Ephemera danica]